MLGTAALCAYIFDSMILAQKLSVSLNAAQDKSPVNFHATGSPILSPISASPSEAQAASSYTNEDLYKNLQKQTVKMGIKDILPGGSKDEGGVGSSPFPSDLFQSQKDNGIYLKGKTPALLKDAQAPKDNSQQTPSVP